MPYRGSKNTIPYGRYIPELNEQEAYRWCINNNIIIFPEMKLEAPWSIEIKINGKINKIWNLRNFIYSNFCFVVLFASSCNHLFIFV